MTISHSGSLRRTSGNLEPVGSVAELQLYEELNAFIDLPADERLEQFNKLPADALLEKPANKTAGETDCEGMPDSAFEVVEMSATRPLLQRPSVEKRLPHPAGALCPSCGEPNQHGDMFCEACGSFLEE